MAKKKVEQKPDDAVWMTFGEIRAFIKDFRRYGSTDSTLAMHRCGQIDGCCIILNIREWDACEEIEPHD